MFANILNIDTPLNTNSKSDEASNGMGVISKKELNRKVVWGISSGVVAGYVWTDGFQ